MANLVCKICGGNVVWCGTDEHHNATKELPHDCHQLVCLDCLSVYDLGYAKGIPNSEDWDDLKKAILELYTHGLYVDHKPT
jgi:hypothetical protein